MRFVKLVFQTTTTNFTVGKVLWESRPTDALCTKIIGLLNKYIHKIDANLFVKKLRFFFVVSKKCDDSWKLNNVASQVCQYFIRYKIF
jgi:hypothetical protein